MPEGVATVRWMYPERTIAVTHLSTILDVGHFHLDAVGGCAPFVSVCMCVDGLVHWEGEDELMCWLTCLPGSF